MVEDRIRAALREIAEAPWVPVEVAKRPTRSFAAAALAATAVALVLAVVVLTPTWWADRRSAGSGDGGPSLPDRFPGYSWLQGRMDGPLGRAVALYTNGTGHEDFGFWQTIVAGADRDTLRRIDLPETSGGGRSAARLSPDGTKVIVGNPHDIITVIDLDTGAHKTYPVAQDLQTAPLAVSADGRRVAFVSYPEYPEEGTLFVLDLATGQTSAPLGRDIRSAAFSPDGERLAVQSPGMIRVIRLDGTVLREIGIAPETLLAGAQAWSPDGTLIVTLHYERGYVFLDAASGEELPATISADLLPNCWGDAVLGWRSPTTMLISTGDVNGTTSNLIAEVDLTDGRRRVLSRFDVGGRGDLAVCDVQLASALVPTLTIRPKGNPDRGPWPAWALITVGVGGALVLIPLALWGFRRRRALAPTSGK